MLELKDRYGAFSWQSDSTLSILPQSLRETYPKAGQTREKAIAFRPAQFVTGPAPSPVSDPDVHLTWGEDFESVWQNFAKLSGHFEVEDPSPKLQHRLNKLKSSEKPRQALYLNRAGGTAGPGTFVDEVFQAVGLINVIQTEGWHSPETETLLSLKPDVIVTSFLDSDYAGVNDRLTRHAALSDKLAETPQIHIPGKFWPCAGPGLVEAAELLSAELNAL